MIKEIFELAVENFLANISTYRVCLGKKHKIKILLCISTKKIYFNAHLKFTNNLGKCF